MGARFNKYNFINTQFFMLPKGLLLYEKYRKNLSAWDILAYAIIRDKAQLSFRNGFFEENGDVYVYFTWDELMTLLGCSRGTLSKILRNLKKMNLIETSKQIFSNANKMYVRELDVPESEDEIAPDNICSDNISDELVREIQQINAIAQMNSDELQEAMEDGTIKSSWNKHLSDNLSSKSELGGSSKSELSEFKNDDFSSSSKFYTAKVQNLNSGVVQNLNSQSSEIDKGSSNFVQGSSDFDTQTISINKTKSNKTISEKEREKERERGRECARAGAGARILEGNPQDLPSKEAGMPYPTREEGSSEGEVSPPVDTPATGEEGVSDASQKEFSEIYSLFRENIQDNPAPIVKKSLMGLCDKYGKEIVLEAITQGALSPTPQEKKGFYYIASIAERISGGKNNFTDYSREIHKQKSDGSNSRIIHQNAKYTQTDSMIECRENIHSMIDNLFADKNDAGEEVEGYDRSNRTGTF